MLSAPKFGNDDDYVDSIAIEVHEKTARTIESFLDPNGIHYVVNGSNASAIYGMSLDCGALPDGRRAGEMLADGTVSPMLYTDTKGPTAVLRSASKVNVPNTYSHLLNQRFLPALLEGEGKEKFADYIQTWMDMGINHIQFNIVSADTLRGAQKNPDKYLDLIVRVAGYSAYFVDLSKGLQDGIIERTEHLAIG
jgi:formate C-acetyltransferase